MSGETSEARVHRVAAQIVADATETSIGPPVPWGEARAVGLRDGSTYLVVHRRDRTRPPRENELAANAIFDALDRTGSAVVVVSLPDGAALDVHEINGALAADVARLRAGPQPAEVAALLRSVEWGDSKAPAHGRDLDSCPSCGGEQPSHAPDCALALMLARCEP